MATPNKPAKKATKTPRKPAATKTASKKTAAKKTTSKATAKKATAKATKATTNKTTSKKTASKTTAAKKTTSKKTASKKTAAKKTTKKTASKATATKTTSKKITKATANKTASNKTAAKKIPKAAANKATSKKPAKAASKKPAAPKPAASGASSDAFSDPGLHLGVVTQVLMRGALDRETLEAALVGVSTDGYEDERVAEAIARVQRVPLDADAVAGITELNFDGGNDIYLLIEAALDIDTGGEESYYELHSLAGVERLRELTELSLRGHGYRAKDLDLTPLTDHPALTTVHLTGRCTNAAALESLPRLKQLTAGPRNVDDPKVLRRLVARGVTVREG